MGKQKGGKKKRKCNVAYRKVVSQLGRDGLAVGCAGEERVLKAFVHANPRHLKLPSWWRGIRRGTPEEDGRGIDHVVHTDIGDIFIQIKSSLHKKTDRFPQRNDRDVAIVYINLKDSDAEIRKRVLRVVARERSSLMRKRL